MAKVRDVAERGVSVGGDGGLLEDEVTRHGDKGMGITRAWG
jgi:hypothetical protein